MKAGESIGAYVVVRQLGSGGMGTVYLAEHAALGRRAAVKVLQPELTSNPEMVKRFFNEARAASAIKSPGIVEIYDFGYHSDGSAYLVMELLEGEALAARLQRFGRLSIGQALVIGRRIASALAPAHRAGIVHRDLKPDNVFLVLDEEVAGGERIKLLDFGIAKLLGDGEPGGAGKLTSTKTVMGSPHYMSPEQCRGAGGVDARSDLYALGCILFELISGQPPFTGEGAGDLIGAHIYLAPRSLLGAAPGVPPEVDALVQRLLAKDPAQRPPRAEDVAAALSELVARFGDPGQQPPSSSHQVAVPAGLKQQAPTVRLGSAPAQTKLGGTPLATERPPPRSPEAVATRRGAPIFALVAAVLLAGGIYAVARSSSEEPPVQGAAGGPAADAALVALETSPVVDAAPSPLDAPGTGAGASPPARALPPPPVPDAGAMQVAEVADRKRSECAQLQGEEKWAELKKCAEELRATKGTSPEDIAAATGFANQSAIETVSKAQYEKFLTANGADDMRGMLTVARNFNKNSMYAKQVQEKWDAAKSKYSAGKMSQARAAARNGKCGELRTIVASVRAYDPRTADEIATIACTTASTAPAVDCASAEAQAAAETQFEEIQGTRVSSDHKGTIRLVEQALSNRCLNPKKSILLRIGVVAACAEKRPDKVKFFYLKTKDPNLISACPDVLGDPGP